jgi:hypothetical protein
MSIFTYNWESYSLWVWSIKPLDVDMLQLNTYLLDSKNIMVYVIEIDYDVRLRKNLFTKKRVYFNFHLGTFHSFICSVSSLLAAVLNKENLEM